MRLMHRVILKLKDSVPGSAQDFLCDSVWNYVICYYMLGFSTSADDSVSIV